MKTIDAELVLNHVMVCSICVPKDATKEQIEEAANRINPTGVSTDWHIPDHYHHDGQKPRVCENNPDRLHVMLHC